jgi:hypothetical protein
MLLLNMALNFMFVCNPKNLQMWQSKLSTYSCFHPLTLTKLKFYFVLVCAIVAIVAIVIVQYVFFHGLGCAFLLLLFVALVVLFSCYLWPWFCSLVISICGLGYAFLLLLFVALIMFFLLLLMFFYYYSWLCSFTITFSCVLLWPLFIALVVICYLLTPNVRHKRIDTL